MLAEFEYLLLTTAARLVDEAYGSGKGSLPSGRAISKEIRRFSITRKVDGEYKPNKVIQSGECAPHSREFAIVALPQ